MSVYGIIDQITGSMRNSIVFLGSILYNWSFTYYYGFQRINKYKMIPNVIRDFLWHKS